MNIKQYKECRIIVSVKSSQIRFECLWIIILLLLSCKTSNYNVDVNQSCISTNMGNIVSNILTLSNENYGSIEVVDNKTMNISIAYNGVRTNFTLFLPTYLSVENTNNKYIIASNVRVNIYDDNPHNIRTYLNVMLFKSNEIIFKVKDFLFTANSFEIKNYSLIEQLNINVHSSNFQEINTIYGRYKVNSISLYSNGVLNTMYFKPLSQYIESPIGNIRMIWYSSFFTNGQLGYAMLGCAEAHIEDLDGEFILNNCYFYKNDGLAYADCCDVSTLNTPYGNFQIDSISRTYRNNIYNFEFVHEPDIKIDSAEFTVNELLVFNNSTTRVYGFFVANETLINGITFNKGDIAAFDGNNRFLGKVIYDDDAETATFDR